jgi:hypothetical protein
LNIQIEKIIKGLYNFFEVDDEDDDSNDEDDDSDEDD